MWKPCPNYLSLKKLEALSPYSSGIGYIPAFVTHQTRKPIYWRDLVNLLPPEPISQATPSNSHQYEIER